MAQTQFEIAQQQVADGKLTPPTVSVGSTDVDYFRYQLAIHRSNLKIMAAGMLCRNIKFTDIKKYYGLKGRSAKDCIDQFQKIMDDYNAKYKAAKEV